MDVMRSIPAGGAACVRCLVRHRGPHSAIGRRDRVPRRAKRGSCRATRHKQLLVGARQLRIRIRLFLGPLLVFVEKHLVVYQHDLPLHLCEYKSLVSRRGVTGLGA